VHVHHMYKIYFDDISCFYACVRECVCVRAHTTRCDRERRTSYGPDHVYLSALETIQPTSAGTTTGIRCCNQQYPKLVMTDTMSSDHNDATMTMDTIGACHSFLVRVIQLHSSFSPWLRKTQLADVRTPLEFRCTRKNTTFQS
jgi:hypothetical protein